MMADLFGATAPPPFDRDAPIVGAPVPPLWPDTPHVHTALYGEAPGRWGADACAVPFLGDKAGVTALGALIDAGCATWPADRALLAWSGAQLRALNLRPVLHGVVLSNAYDRCPADERVPARTRIRAPKRAELADPANLARVAGELAEAHARGLRQVLAMGRVAGDLLAPLVAPLAGVALVRLPHPSAQGLLMAAPNSGAGCKLADLAAAWEARLRALLTAAAAAAAQAGGAAA